MQSVATVSHALILLWRSLPKLSTIDKSYLNFINAIKNKETLEGYCSDMREMRRFFGYRVYGQFLEGEVEAMEDNMIRFVLSKEGTVSSSRVRRMTAAARLFYDMNRKTLNWKFINRHIKKTKKIKDEAYNHAQVGQMVKIATRREKVLVLGYASTGIRRAAMPDIIKRNLIPIDKYGIYKIVPYEGEDEEYTTYSSPEWRQAVDDYYAYRERCGEKIDGNSLLIRDEFDRNDIIHARAPERLDEERVSDVLTDLAEKAGLRVKVKLTEGMKPGRIRHKVKAVHGLRKFWDTQMTLSGVSPLWTELLEGHKIKGMKHHYLRPSDEELLYGSNDSKFLGYTAAIDRLTIDPGNRAQKENLKLKDELKNAAPKDMVADLMMQNKSVTDALAEEQKNRGSDKKQIDKLTGMVEMLMAEKYGKKEFTDVQG